MAANFSEMSPSNFTKGGDAMMQPPFAGPYAIGFLSFVFAAISIIGIVGNSLVVFVVIVDVTMRKSVTNMLILNLAVADFVVTLFGIPEIVQFMINRGWLLGVGLCRFNRFMILGNLYASIMTLVSLCVERYIAIVHPLKAHIFCSKRNVLIAIAVIWPLSFLSSSYTALYNKLHRPAPQAPVTLCVTELPGDSLVNNTFDNSMLLHYGEMVAFYFIPVLVQVVLYSIVGARLFRSTAQLYGASGSQKQNGATTGQSNETLKARRSVVQMLIACVVVYVVSYSPHQFLLIYYSVAKKQVTWEVHVFAMVMAQLNSAANPILYCVISQKFRRAFEKYLCALCRRYNLVCYLQTTPDSSAECRPPSSRKTTATKVSVTSM